MEKINTSTWKKFQIGSLFEVRRPAARSQTKYEEGTTPFVASGNYNNGIVMWCEPKEGEMLDSKGCISVSPLDGSSFYQPEDFLGRGGAGSSILLLRNSNLTEKSALFICTVLKAALTKFSYNDQINSNSILVQTIILPVLDDGTPNFEYMEAFMSDVIEESVLTLDLLKRIMR